MCLYYFPHENIKNFSSCSLICPVLSQEYEYYQSKFQLSSNLKNINKPMPILDENFALDYLYSYSGALHSSDHKEKFPQCITPSP